MKNNIIKAVRELYENGDISFYDTGKYTESDFNTKEINWSEYEIREPEEILELDI